MYKALNDFAPNYVSDLTEIYVPERNLRSAQSRQLIQPTFFMEFSATRNKVFFFTLGSLRLLKHLRSVSVLSDRKFKFLLF